MQKRHLTPRDNVTVIMLSLRYSQNKWADLDLKDAIQVASYCTTYISSSSYAGRGQLSIHADRLYIA